MIYVFVIDGIVWILMIPLSPCDVWIGLLQAKDYGKTFDTAKDDWHVSPLVIARRDYWKYPLHAKI